MGAEATVLLAAQMAVVHCAVLPATLQRDLLPQFAEGLGVQLELGASAAVGWPPAARGVPPPDPFQARVGRQPGSPATHRRQVRAAWEYAGLAPRTSVLDRFCFPRCGP